MNAKLSEYLRAISVSPELFAVLLVLLLTGFFPTPFQQFGSKVGASDVAVQLSILGAPVALLGIAWGLLVEKVLHPSEEHRKLLLSWPDYWRLRIRVHASLGWGVVGVALVVAGFLTLWAGSFGIGAACILAGVSVAALVVATSALAFMSLRDILDNAPDGG